MIIPTCPCGHPLDLDGFCLVPDRWAEEMHRVSRWSSRCIDCGRQIIDTGLDNDGDMDS